MPRPSLQRAECAAHADHYGLRRLHARQGLEYASRTMSAEPEHDPVPNDAQQAQGYQGRSKTGDRVKILVIAVFLVLVGTAKADTGNELQQNCQGNSGELYDVRDVAFGICMGYIRGVLETQDAWHNEYDYIQGKHPGDMWGAIAAMPIIYCIPGKVTLGQVQQIVIKYLDANPDKLHQSGQRLIGYALQSAFPCPSAK